MLIEETIEDFSHIFTLLYRFPKLSNHNVPIFVLHLVLEAGGKFQTSIIHSLPRNSYPVCSMEYDFKAKVTLI